MRFTCCKGRVAKGVVNDFYSFLAPARASLRGVDGIGVKIMSYVAWRVFCFVLE